MDRFKIVLLLALLHISIPSWSQEFKVKSYDAVAKIKTPTGWIQLKHDDKLFPEDTVCIKEGGKLVILNCKDNRLVGAYEGKWEVKQIWEQKAIPKNRNTNSKAGDTVKGAQSAGLSLDFLTSDWEITSEVKPNSKLNGVVITNHGADSLYCDILWIDSNGKGEESMVFDLLEGNDFLSPETVNIISFTDPVQLDDKTNVTKVYILYSTKDFKQIELSPMSLSDLEIKIDSLKLKYAIRDITYDKK